MRKLVQGRKKYTVDSTLENETPILEWNVIWTIKLKELNECEAFRKIIYIIRIFYTSKLSKSFKNIKAKIYFKINMRAPKLLLFHLDSINQ